MSRFLIIGKSFFKLNEYLSSHEYSYVTLLDRDTTRPKNTKNAVLCDFSSEDRMLETVKNAHESSPFDGLLVVYENYVLPAAKIAKKIGLPGMPIEAASACTDKEIMRQLFSKASEKISPEFIVVKNKDDLRDFSSKHGFPLILKPANLSKSLLVTKANNLEELELQYDHTMSQISEIYNKYAKNRHPKLILEEFIEGSIHSVDAFIDSSGNVDVLEEVVDYETGQDIGYNDNFHYSRTLPSKLSASEISAIRHAAKIGCRSLGMKSSPAHIEIILSTDGPRIVEIGARNGGYRERMHGLANGIDLTECTLLIALGKKPNIKATRDEPCVVLELFPKHDGIYQSIANEKALESLDSLAYYSPKAKSGTFIGKSTDGYKASAVIILHNKNQEQFDEDYAFVRKNVFVETKEL